MMRGYKMFLDNEKKEGEDGMNLKVR
jgi:hypothetical protein